MALACQPGIATSVAVAVSPCCTHGEGGGLPAATARCRVVSTPSGRRDGVINAGTQRGRHGPPLLALIITAADWRAVFYVTGVMGLGWAVWWWYAYYPPDRHPALGADERRLLEPVIAGGRSAEAAPPWLALLRFRQVWGLVVAKFLSDAALYFYLFWLENLYERAASTSRRSARSPGFRSPPPASAASSAGGSRAICSSAACRSIGPARSPSASAPP